MNNEVFSMIKEWQGFKEGNWCKEVNVKDFIQKNYIPYEGNSNFLASVSDKTNKVWNKCLELLKEELEHGVLDIDTVHMSGIDAFEVGYIDKKNETIVGLQTDAPLKRMINPYGGIKMVYKEMEAYGKELDYSFNEKEDIAGW